MAKKTKSDETREPCSYCGNMVLPEDELECPVCGRPGCCTSAGGGCMPGGKGCMCPECENEPEEEDGE